MKIFPYSLNTFLFFDDGGSWLIQNSGKKYIWWENVEIEKRETRQKDYSKVLSKS